MSDARICIIGSLTIDLVARAPRLPSPGETVLGSSFAAFPGGKGANQAVAAARMCAQVSLIGAVGDDHYGRHILETLAAENLDLSQVHTRPGPSGIAVLQCFSGWRHPDHGLSARTATRCCSEFVQTCPSCRSSLSVPREVMLFRIAALHVVNARTQTGSHRDFHNA